jgi:hypothetical protein
VKETKSANKQQVKILPKELAKFDGVLGAIGFVCFLRELHCNINRKTLI